MNCRYSTALSVLIVLAVTVLSRADVAANDDFSVVEANGVRIESFLHAQIYRWQIFNVNAEPIMRFEIPQHNCYNQEVPFGWTYEFDGERFVAWATQPRYAISSGQSGEFTARGSSSGAVLGVVPASIGFDEHSADVTFPKVWAPRPKPVSMVWLVALTIAGMGLLHVALARRKTVGD